MKKIIWISACVYGVVWVIVFLVLGFAIPKPELHDEQLFVTDLPRKIILEKVLQTSLKRVFGDTTRVYIPASQSVVSRKTIFENEFFWLLLVGVVIIYVLRTGCKTRCPRCRKWWAMKVVGRELIDQRASTVLKKDKLKNSMGKVILTHEVRVPATIYTYRVYRRCKHEGCGGGR